MCLIQSGSKIVSFMLYIKLYILLECYSYYQWSVCVGCFYASVTTTVNVAG